MSGSFFDSNVLLYLALDDPQKASRCEDLLAHGGTISAQVLNEIVNVARRKYQKPWPEINIFLELIRGFLHVTPITIEVHETGLELARRYGLSIYDGMIVAAALLADCDRLWSEDMQHGLLVSGRLRVLNPFRNA